MNFGLRIDLGGLLLPQSLSTMALARIAGFATAEATAAHRDKLLASKLVNITSYRSLPSGVAVSSIGVGTYQGELGPAHDKAVVDAIVASVRAGVNVIDTAVNYRLQQGERCVGQALQQLCRADSTDAEPLPREALFISTKAGFVPGDYAISADKEEGMKHTAEELLRAGVPQEDICDEFRHTLHPRALELLLEKSLSNLGVDTVDLFYLHNAENQIGMGVSREALMERIGGAFRWCERAIAAGKIRMYGLATWDCFRAQPSQEAYLSLADLVAMATAAAKEVRGEGASSAFAAVQIPINVGKLEAIAVPTQGSAAVPVPSARYAADLGLDVFASSSLGGGDAPASAQKCEEHGSVQRLLPGSVRWLQFTRSCPAVSCALVGMKRLANVEANLSLLKVEPLCAADFADLLSTLQGS